MKSKLACILLVVMCVMGYNSTAEATTMIDRSNISQKQHTKSQNNLRIINSVSAVKRGGTGIITIQGMPNTLYSIKTSYKLINKTVSVTQWRTTDETGVITFNWIVSMETMSGTYDATISGGGDVLKTNHKVLP